MKIKTTFYYRQNIMESWVCDLRLDWDLWTTVLTEFGLYLKKKIFADYVLF